MELPFFYAVTDTKHGQIELIPLINKLVAGGARLVQYRDKDASPMRYRKNALQFCKLCHAAGVTFLLNDYVALVYEVDADGVHLGQDDTSIEEARTILGHKKIIGVSTHSLTQALHAQSRGADYVSIGPVYWTQTKPDYEPVGLAVVRHVVKAVSIPIVAIGGITLERLSDVLKTGVRSVAMVSTVCHSQNIEKTLNSITSIAGVSNFARHPYLTVNRSYHVYPTPIRP